MKVWQTWLIVACVLFGLAMIVRYAYSAGFNPGDYPGIYNSYAIDGVLEASGVISTGHANYGACEFYNGSAGTAYFTVYNSSTVAGQTVSNMVGFCQAAAAGVCSVLAAGPTGPAINAAIVAYNGFSWFGSSTFPTQTGIGAAGLALCSFNVR